MRCSSVCVERLVWVQEVAGSSPVTATKFILYGRMFQGWRVGLQNRLDRFDSYRLCFIGLAMIAIREYSKGGLTNCRYICSQSKHYDFLSLHVTNGDSF